ncbi:MAG: riboflavin synthase subunit alpha [Fimbriimonadales bacterium]
MFTGLIEAVGSVAEPLHSGRLWISAPFAAESGPGHSVAVNGVCLTVVEKVGDRLLFELSEETVQRTALGSLTVGTPVNLERPLRADAELGGHFVQGHVDGVGKLVEVETLEDSWMFKFRAPTNLAAELVQKGSVAVDGISLTVVDLFPSGEFTVAIIPFTFEHTNLGTMKPGTPVNIETDILGKYVRRFMELRQSPQAVEV